MKQHITPKQAAEISEYQFASMFDCNFVRRKDWTDYHHKKVTIGKMIDFLVDRKWDICIEMNDKNFLVKNNIDEKEYLEKELCDALWEAVKDNL